MEEKKAPKPPLTRRQFLQRLGVASLLIIGSGGLYLRFFAYEQPPSGFKHLNAMEYTLSRQLGDHFFPENNPLGVSARSIDLSRRIDEQFGMFDGEMRGKLHILFLVVEYGTFFMALRPFTHLSRPDQARLLAQWEHAESYIQRLLFKALKFILTLTYFSHEKVKLALDYNPACGGLG